MSDEPERLHRCLQLVVLLNPETPISLNYNKECTLNYNRPGSFYSLRSIPARKDIGVSGKLAFGRMPLPKRPEK